MTGYGRSTGALLIVLLLSQVGCAKIPAEAVQLNQVVNTNIADVRSKHETLVSEYFKLKFELFDKWFVETYEPRFKENYKKAFKGIKKVDFDPNNSAHHTLYVQDVIAEYEDLTSQIKQIEASLLESIEEKYTQMLAANEAVGELLASARAVTEAQRRLWNSTAGRLIPGLDADKIDQQIAAIQSHAISGLGG